MKTKVKKYLFLFLIIFVAFMASCQEKTFNSKFTSIKEGMSKDKVYQTLGEPDDIDSSLEDKGVLFCYWFEGAKDMDEAQTRTNEGKRITYYLVILTVSKGTYYVIEDGTEKGIWGEDS